MIGFQNMPKWLISHQQKLAEWHFSPEIFPSWRNSKIRTPFTRNKPKTGGCFQPLWKICSSKWVHLSPNRDEHSKNIWSCHHPEKSSSPPFFSGSHSIVFPDNIHLMHFSGASTCVIFTQGSDRQGTLLVADLAAIRVWSTPGFSGGRTPKSWTLIAFVWGETKTGWWIQPTWKILVKMGISPSSGETKRYLKPPTRTWLSWWFQPNVGKQW